MAALNPTGSELQQIRQALLASFSPPDLDELVQINYPPMHSGVIWGQAPGHVVFSVIRTAEQHGALDLILAGAAVARPHRPDLRALTFYFSRRPGWTAPVAANDLNVRGALEQLTSSADPFLDTSRLARWVIRVERQVCLVRSGAQKGTGYLVGPDLVLTCYHVVDNHLQGKVNAAEVQAKFDYRRAPDGTAPPAYDGEGWVGIDPMWPIPHAPYGQADITLAGDPAASDLDFALLKLSRPVGQLNPPNEPGARGWIDLSRDQTLPAAQGPILIVQHPGDGNLPQQMPLQITFATPGFVGPNGNGTRLIYLPSTRAGSSGSPVFDRSLQAVALHHNRGQINPAAVDVVNSNRGIPLDRIREALPAGIRSQLVRPPAGP